jgi:replicative DNA helicase
MLEVTRRALLNATALAKDATPDTAQESIATIRNMIMCAELDAPETDIHPADTAIEQVNEWRTTDILNRSGLHWFLPTIDRTVGPLTDELVYLNSMPSVGKTAFSLNMVCAAAWSSVRCSFVSLESPRSKIAQRITSIVSGHNANAMKFRRTIDAHYDEAVEKLKAFKQMPSGWTFTARSIEQIYSWARTEQKRGSRAILIDNMKHIRTGKADSTVEQFRELSLRLKEMKDMLGMAVIVLHHLNDDGKVSWSRDIERDADIILNLVNADNDLAAEVRRVKFICQKNRDGNTGEIDLLFDKPKQTFEEA